MRLLGTVRATFAATAVACLFAGLPGTDDVLAAGDSLSITPGILEHVARPGGVGSVKISNTTRRSLKVRVTLRPWLQARNGAVTPNRRKVLGKVRPRRRAFRLRAGASRRIRLALVRRPKRRSLYGAIEVTGAPLRPGGRGVRVAYRLVTSLRLFPPARARRFGARAGRLYVRGRARRSALFLAVKNAGNTIDPIGATVRIRGRGRTLRNQVVPRAILPGRTVNLRLARLRGSLPRGRYNVAVRLSQAGRGLGTIRRRGVRLR